ncbi:hypothetical protein LNQ03_07760 [Klebsiella pneumoniae subsp. pneumoniae]|nr:hypothetical protein [Klebsiella pneumoniae subsp. pneumoniae]
MTAVEIEGLSRVLGKFRSPFTIHEFKTQMTDLAGIYSRVDKLDQNHKAGDLLKKLYTVGVVGNYITGKRGKQDSLSMQQGIILWLHLEEHFIVHPAVRTIFQY